MSVEWVAGLMVLIAVLALGGAALLFFRERDWFLQWLRGTAGVLLTLGALYLVLMAGSLFSYQPVSEETPMASVSFVANGPQNWDATVTEANGRTRVFELRGDLWQLDVRLLRYSGLGAIFGTDPSFQLDRLVGRYLSLEDEAGKDHSEYVLHTEPALGFDIWERASEGSLFVKPVLTSVVLVPIVDGAIYEVVLNEDGLLAVRAANSIAQEAAKSVGGA